MASNTERVLQTYVAPILMTWWCRSVILVAYVIFTGICLHKCFNIRTYWGHDLYINEDWPQHDFYNARKIHFDKGIVPATYVQFSET